MDYNNNNFNNDGNINNFGNNQTDPETSRKSKKLSIASLICLGVAALTFMLCITNLQMIYVSMPFNIVALILAIISKSKDKNNAIAVVAIILSITCIIFGIMGYYMLTLIYEMVEIFSPLCDCGGMS